MLEKADKDFIARKLNIYVPSQNATSLTSLNAVLGQNSVNVFEFTKQYNALTKDYLNDIILNIDINLRFDKKFEIKIKGPVLSFLIYEQMIYKQKCNLDDVNFLYEIKLTDLYKTAIFIKKIRNMSISIKSLLKTLIASVNSMHIKIHNDLP